MNFNFNSESGVQIISPLFELMFRAVLGGRFPFSSALILSKKGLPAPALASSKKARLLEAVFRVFLPALALAPDSSKYVYGSGSL